MYIKPHRVIPIVLLLLSSIGASADSLPFSPIVRNWSVQHNHASKQNWSIAQAEDGVMVIGNGQGLFEFDGWSWRSHDVANGNCVRSVLVDGERIYVGAYRQFGYLDRKTGEYVSLSDSVDPSQVGDDDVWNICKTDDGSILFQSFSAFFLYDGRHVRTVTGLNPLNLFKVGGQLWSQQIEGGLYTINNDGSPGREVIKYLGPGHQIVSVLPYGQDGVLLLSLNKGLKIFHKDGAVTKLKTDFEDELGANTFNRGCVTPDGLFILGTITDGIFACDSLGHLKWAVNTTNGLQNNTVLGLACDQDKNVWAALDDGISLVQDNSDISCYRPFREDIGMVYDVLDYNGDFYAATNQGLFYYENGGFRRISPVKEQVWYVKNFGDQILSGNNMGTLSIMGNSATKERQEFNNSGAFCIRRVNWPDGNAYLIEGTYSGLNIYSKSEDGIWKFRNTIYNVSLPRQIEVDNGGQIWCQHFHRGIKKVKLNADLTAIEEITDYDVIGDVSGKLFPLFKINGTICVYNGQKFYIYEEMQDRLQPSDEMNTSLAELKGIHGVTQACGKSFWFVGNERAWLVDIGGQDFRIIRDVKFSKFGEYSEERSSIVYDPKHKASYLCLANLIVRIEDGHASGTKDDRNLTLIGFRADNKDGGTMDGLKLADNKFKSGFNSVHFLLRYPDYSSDNLIMKIRLAGLHDQWHASDFKMAHDYHGLKPGRYQFEARICNRDGVASEIQVPFIIGRPWYTSASMLVLYLFIGIVTVLLVERSVSRFASYVRSLHHVQSEKKALETALKDKSNELATMAAKGIAIDDQSWEIFKKNLERMDEKFFSNLQSAYPSLTSADLKFCALLRLNLSTKEIANTLNLTTRGVDSARYRLRKKFGLEASDSLSGFIINFTASQQKGTE